MKYKKGDKVRIRPDLENLMFDMPKIFSELCVYAGKVAKISNIAKGIAHAAYVLDIDCGSFLWPEDYIMDIYDNANDVKKCPISPTDALREISMMVEKMQLKEFDIQCTEGVINFTMARKVEE